MRLFHGTNVDFDVIDLSYSHRYKDFGRGFYLTDIRSQAEDLSSKRAHIYGGVPLVQEYDFEETCLQYHNLKVKSFEKVSAEWASFIYKNRSRQLDFSHDYDIVVGPIADDGVAYLLDRFEEGTYTLEELAIQLEYKKLNRQYFFGSERALEYLKRVR